MECNDNCPVHARGGAPDGGRRPCKISTAGRRLHRTLLHPCTAALRRHPAPPLARRLHHRTNSPAGPPTRPSVVLIAEELAPSVLAVLGDGFEIRHVDGADRAALLPALADVDAVLIRSATQVDAEALAAAPRLRSSPAAGIGLDNVDVPAATARGVMVVNAPQSNIVSAAEQAVALLLACARNIAPANEALKQGKWQRSKWTGVEVADKTVGVVGLGRIGVLFAQRMSAFGTRLIAYDPYISPARAAQIGVRLVTLDELLRESDFISIHLPKTPGDGRADRQGAARALQAQRAHHQRRPRRPGRRAGARRRARERAGRRRRHRRVRHRAVHRLAAVRVRLRRRQPAPGRLDRRGAGQGRHRRRPIGPAGARGRLRPGRGQRPGRRRGRRGGATGPAAGREARPGLHRRWPGASPPALEVEVRGEIAAHDVSVLQLAALKGVFADVVEEQVTFVNAPTLAAERGVEVSLTTDADSPDYRSLITVRGVLPNGAAVGVAAR